MAEEKVEMSDVPKDAETEKPTQEEAPPANATKARKSLLSGLFAKKEKKDALLSAEETTDPEKENVKSPVKKWFQCPFKKHTDAADSHHCPMDVGLNLIDRDEKMVNEHIKLSFEDILAEPDGYHSWNWVWKNSHRLFQSVRWFIYRLLAMLLFLPCTIVWAVVFAIVTSLNVWVLTPLAKALSIPATWLAKTWAFLIASIFDPLFRSCSLCCNRGQQNNCIGGFGCHPERMA